MKKIETEWIVEGIVNKDLVKMGFIINFDEEKVKKLNNISKKKLENMFANIVEINGDLNIFIYKNENDKYLSNLKEVVAEQVLLYLGYSESFYTKNKDSIEVYFNFEVFPSTF